MLLALEAFEEARLDAGLSLGDLEDRGTALINATTVGGMCLTDELYRGRQPTKPGVPNYLYFLRLRFRRFVSFRRATGSRPGSSIPSIPRVPPPPIPWATGPACSGTASPAGSLRAGWTALPNSRSPWPTCRRTSWPPGPAPPLTGSAAGLSLGEGAAFVVLEREEDVRPGTVIYARLSGLGTGVPSTPLRCRQRVRGPTSP